MIQITQAYLEWLYKHKEVDLREERWHAEAQLEHTHTSRKTQAHEVSNILASDNSLHDLLCEWFLTQFCEELLALIDFTEIFDRIAAETELEQPPSSISDV